MNFFLKLIISCSMLHYVDDNCAKEQWTDNFCCACVDILAELDGNYLEFFWRLMDPEASSLFTFSVSSNWTNVWSNPSSTTEYSVFPSAPLLFQMTFTILVLIKSSMCIPIAAAAAALRPRRLPCKNIDSVDTHCNSNFLGDFFGKSLT